MITSKDYIKNLLPSVPDDANKYTKGSATMFVGSFGMAGAALLSAKACLRSGAGIVRLVVPKGIYPICAGALWEAVYTPVKDVDGEFSVDTYEKVAPYFSKSDAIAFGCGVGLSSGVDETLRSLITKNTKPLIIDADGINSLSKHIDLLKEKACPIVLTPHEGEMSRLLDKSVGYIRSNRAEVAVGFATRFGVTLLLKGKNTVIASADGDVFINPTGNSGLATAGSGDVLTGIITALISSGLSPFDAAVAGAYIHGLSGDIAAEKLGSRSMTASDIIEYLPNAFKEC